MGDISNKNFELTDSAKLKMSLLDDLRNNPNKKQIIKLKGNSSLLFANLTALTLASCGGGGGGSSAPSPTPSFSFSNQNFTFSEDSSGTFSISAPTNAEGTVSITVNSVPNGISLTASDGTVLSAGSTLSNTLLSGISYTLDENANSELNNFGSLSLTASDGTNSATSSISFTVTAVDDVPVLETSSFLICRGYGISV